MNNSTILKEGIAKLNGYKVPVRFSFTFIAILWLMFGIESFLDIDLSPFGILPRHTSTLGGIFLSPLVHIDFFHLFGNTIALLPLMIMFLTLEQRNGFIMFIIGYVGTGLGVWLFGREMGHYGVSGFIFFLCTYLIVLSFYKKNLFIIAGVSLTLLLLNFLFDVLISPTEGMSWESHSIGAVLGICAPLMYYKEDSESSQ